MDHVTHSPATKINILKLKEPKRKIYVSKETMNLFQDYTIDYHTDDVDSNYVFINLRGKNKGKPMQYWALDEWNTETFPIKDRKRKIRENRQSVDFTKISNDFIKLEIKYYSFYSLTNEIWLLSSFIESHFNKMYFLSKFSIEKHPRITSIIDIPYNKLLDEYKIYLTQNNKSLKQPHPRGGEYISPYLGVFKNMYDFFLIIMTNDLNIKKINGM